MFYNKKPKKLSPFEEAILNVRDATANLRHAQQNFNRATSDYFEIANTELSAARHRLDVALMEAKRLQPTEEPKNKAGILSRIFKHKKKEYVNPQGDINFEVPEEVTNSVY